MGKVLGKCNLCGWPVIRFNTGDFGSRCLRCLSTQVHRAVGAIIRELPLSAHSRVYELSSRGALFHYLRRTFRDFYFSEFFDGVPTGEMKGGIPCQDVQNLKIPDHRFDLITSTEVFEHVPDDRKGFAEIFRVLQPGGHFVFTVPLLEGPGTLERAHLNPDGSLHHELPPEYHSDRIRGKKTVLAFRTYGTDIVHRLNQAGFSAVIRRIDLPRSSIHDQPVILAKKGGGYDPGR